jgi:hypothetical protein
VPRMGGPGGKDAAGGKAAEACRRARRGYKHDAGAELRAARVLHDRRAGDRELSSPLSRMQRPCRGVRCEHKVSATRVARGSCERGAAAWERRLCGAAFSDGVSRDVLPEPELAGAHPNVTGGGCTARDTGHGGRSPRWAPSWWSGLGLATERAPGERRSCTCPRASELQGPGRGDRGTGRRAVSHALARWSGRPCGRNLRKCSEPGDGVATARAPAGPVHEPPLMPAAKRPNHLAPAKLYGSRTSCTAPMAARGSTERSHHDLTTAWKKCRRSSVS